MLPAPAASPDAAVATSSDEVPSPDTGSYAAFAQCSVLSVEEASRSLGYDVLPPEARARAGGNCFLTSQSMSEDGSVAYALVTAARLVALRPYFIALARRCAGVAVSSPRAAACALYVKLAAVRDLDAYYAARTERPDAAPVAPLDGADVATSADGTIFVRRGAAVLEAAVRRDGAFDLERSEALARLLLLRLRAPASPGPSPSGV